MTKMTLIDGTPVALGDTVYDLETKDFIRITNGKCALPHHDQDAFRATHPNGIASCRYVPSEGTVLRCVGLDEQGRALVAFTYRAIDAGKVRPASQPTISVSALQHGIRPRRNFVGRV